MLDLALFRSSSFSYPGREWGLQRRVGGGGRGSAAQEATGGTYQPAIDLDLADLVHVCDVDGISPPTGGTTMYRFEKVFFISWQGSAPASPSLQRPVLLSSLRACERTMPWRPSVVSCFITSSTRN